MIAKQGKSGAMLYLNSYLSTEYFESFAETEIYSPFDKNHTYEGVHGGLLLIPNIANFKAGKSLALANDAKAQITNSYLQLNRINDDGTLEFEYQATFSKLLRFDVKGQKYGYTRKPITVRGTLTYNPSQTY